MELSSVELHVFVSLTVILGSGLIALIVDYLKGSNEQLRERNIELRIRREEEGRRSITEIRLLREQMVAAADAAWPAEQSRDAALILEPAAAAATLAAQPESAPSAQAIIEQAVERAVRNAAAEKAESEPDKQSAPTRDRPRSAWWESATSKPQPRLEVVARKEAAEEKKPGPPKVEKAPDSLLDHVIFATEPNGGAARVEPSPAEPEVERVVERVALAARPATDLAAAEPSRVVFVTPLVEPGVLVTGSLSLPEPEPAPAEFPAPEIEPAAALAAAPQEAEPEVEPVVFAAEPAAELAAEPSPTEFPAPEIEPAAALAAAPEEAEPEVEPVVFAAEPAAELAAAEPSRVVFATPSVEPAPAEFLAPEIEPMAALAAEPQEVEPEIEPVVFAAEPAAGLAAEPSPTEFPAPEIEPAAALAAAPEEAEPEVEPVVFAAEPAAELAAAEPSRVVFMTPLVEPAPAEFLAPEIEPMAALAAAPQEAEPEVEPEVFAVEPTPAEFPAPEIEPAATFAAAPATDLAAAEPSRVVFMTPLVEPGIPEAGSLSLPEPEPAPVVVEEPPMEPAPAEFLASEIEPAAALAAARQTEVESIPPVGEPEPRISISSGLVVRREPAREAGPKLVRPVAELPTGFFEAAEIATLIGQNQSLTGVVIAIGINDYQRALQGQSKGGAQELAGSVDRLIRSLISANDFAYRRADDEFIVVFPNEKGAAAQNRIHQVAERLWDYQLRSLAAFSVMFSWGAVTVDEESFSEAVALAADEMSETRDSRRGFGMEAIRPRRRAVSF